MVTGNTEQRNRALIEGTNKMSVGMPRPPYHMEDT